MQSNILNIFLFAFLLVSCKNRGPQNTPTSGELVIQCDEQVAPVIEAEIFEFEKSYPQAHITLKLATTNYAIGSLLNNSVDCIISTRELDSAETDFLIRNDVRVYSQKVALDGIAFVVNANNPIDEINFGQLRSLFEKQTLWNEISDTTIFSSNMKEVRLVIDGFKSGNYYLLRHQVMNDEPMTSTALIMSGDSSASSSEQILNYVASHDDAIGYVSTAWLGHNSTFIKWSKQLKVLRLAGMDYEKAVAPIQGYIYRGDYPLRRMIYIMHRQRHTGLAAGFTAYLTGNDGQRVFLNSNLVPAMNPIRLKYE